MLGIKGYVANTIYVHGKAVMSRFENAQVEITAFDAEKIGGAFKSFLAIQSASAIVCIFVFSGRFAERNTRQ